MAKVQYSAEELAKFGEVGGKPIMDASVAAMSAQFLPEQELLDLVHDTLKASAATDPEDRPRHSASGASALQDKAPARAGRRTHGPSGISTGSRQPAVASRLRVL